MKKGVGLYIGQKEVIAASLSFLKGSPVLDRFAIEPISESKISAPQPIPISTEKKKKSLFQFQKQTENKNRTPQASAIVGALEKIGARNAPVVAAFNPFQLVTRYFQMPYLPRKEWETAAAYEAARYLPFKLSEVIADFQILEGKDSSGNKALAVTASTVRTEVLRSYVHYLREASVNTEAIEPVFSAYSRALSAVETFENAKTYGFIFMDSDGSVNVTLSKNGIVYLSRDFSLSEDRRGNETRFYEELKVSFDFMNRTASSDHIDRVYLAGSGDLIFWADFLTSTFGKEVHFEFGLFPTKQDVPKNALCALLIPIGLALRSLKYKSFLGDFSLLPTIEKETKPERVKRLVKFELLGIALLFIFLRLVVLEPYIIYLRQKLIGEANIKIAAVPALSSITVPELQKIRTELEQEKKQIKAFSKQKISMSSKLKGLARTMPNSIWLSQITYKNEAASGRSRSSENQERKIVLSGQCYIGNPEAEVKAINDWAKSLEQDKEFLGDFHKVTVAEVRRERYMDKETSSFRVVVE